MEQLEGGSNDRESSTVQATVTTITTTTVITHVPPPVVMTPCSAGGAGTGEGRSRGGSLKVDPQITINLSKPAAGGQSQTLSISPPRVMLDRRPSTGANVIPQAALCQHRHSLQMNGDGGVYRVSGLL